MLQTCMSRCGALAVVVLLMCGSWVGGALLEVHFGHYADVQLVEADWKVGRWPIGPMSNRVQKASGERGVMLVASQPKGGGEGPGFGQTSLTHRTYKVGLGPGSEASIDVSVSSYPTFQYVDRAAAQIGFGFTGQGGDPSIQAIVGCVKERGRRGRVSARVELRAGGETEVIYEGQTEGPSSLEGKTLRLEVDDASVRLTLDGETLLGAAEVDHGIDWSSSSLTETALLPTVRAMKLYGNDPYRIGVARLMADQVSGGLAQASLGTDVEEQLSSSPWAAYPLVRPPSRVTARLGEEREIARDYVGMNGNLTAVSQFWDNRDLSDAMRQLNLGNLRYPAGTIGNYWDWDTGWLDRNAPRDRMMHWVQGMVEDSRTYTLENYAKGQKRLGFTPVFMLNMVTKDLENQLGQLRRAERLGMPVKYVELGNEYFFGIGAEPLVHVKFPTPEAYAEACNVWTSAIKAEFPEAKVAVIGSDGGPPHVSERRRTWNQHVIPHLSDEVDAVTLHPYAGVGLLPGGPRPWGSAEQQNEQARLLQDPEAVQFMMLVPHEEWGHIRHSFPELTPYDLWLTEFNVNDRMGGVRHTWAQGLALSSMLSVFLEDENVTLLCFHNPYGGNLFNALHDRNGSTFDGLLVKDADAKAEPLAVTPTGLVMSLFGHAANGRDRVASVDFGGEVELEVEGGSSPLPLIRGWRFSDSGGELGPRGVLLNLTPDAVEVDVRSLGITEDVGLQYSGAPTLYMSSPELLDRAELRLSSSLRLPGYSITILGSDGR
ncbi:hypothetical protein [Mucisphaera calidilacus]|uniref:Uncharacterized protein n=1 Tax=Mucisphaera calidilacus TaxID=2527982 RepID=A0A518BUG5_9BACT|nr:hypothetical protein [Mucisphaera calidilacus]QDU70632.1 hypothetical protein Pan265_04600 [Mucisphaera calidilacus]